MHSAQVKRPLQSIGRETCGVLCAHAPVCRYWTPQPIYHIRSEELSVVSHRLNFALTTRFKLTPSSAASITSRLCTSGGTRTTNLSVYRSAASGSGTGSPFACIPLCVAHPPLRTFISINSPRRSGCSDLTSTSSSPKYNDRPCIRLCFCAVHQPLLVPLCSC